MYSKTHWRDRVVDSETGEVIQEGTFMSAEHFNNMENGIAANDVAISGINNDIDTIETTLETGVGTTIGLTINQSTFVMKFALKNSEGTVLSEEEVDLPIESMIINAEYAADSKSLILTLQSGSTVTVPLSALINGLVNESRKVAGIDLKDDITVPELESALEVDKLKTNVDKIANHINGNLTDSDFAEDSTAVMVKTVPSGMADYAAVKVIGGKTRKFNQLCSGGKSEVTNGTTVDTRDFVQLIITADSNSWNSATIKTTGVFRKNLTASRDATKFVLKHSGAAKDIGLYNANIPTYTGHKYILSMNFKGYNPSVSDGLKVDNIMLFDLTAMFGSGNEPTLEQFNIMFPDAYYDYDTGSLWNAPVESVVSKGRNLLELTGWYKRLSTTTLPYKDGDYVVVAKNESGTAEYLTKSIYIPETADYVLRFEEKVDSGILSNITYSITDEPLSTYNSSGTTWDMANSKQTIPTSVTKGKYLNVIFALISNKTGTCKFKDLKLVNSNLVSEPYTEPFKTTLLLPDSIKNLPDYGVGIDPEHCNWIDFENMVYHHDYTLADLTGKSWTSDGNGVFHTSYPTNAKVKAYGICNNYMVDYNYNTPQNVGDMIVRDPTYNVMYVKVESGTSPDTTGTLLYYELADDKKELIDISDILYPIRCEAGGIIMLNNEHSLDVPNTIIYKKEAPTT